MLLFLFITQTTRNTYLEVSNLTYLSFKRRFRPQTFLVTSAPRTLSTIELSYIFKKSKSQENLIFKLTRLNPFIHQESESKGSSERDTVSMSNRERTTRSRSSVDYSHLSTEEAPFYQVSESFADHQDRSVKTSMFNTRLNRLKKVLNTQSQIVEEDSYEFNVFNSSNSLLKHNIFDSKSEKNEEEMKDSQETTYENSHTSTRETNHQITSSFTKIHRQSRHKQSHRRFILESQSATQQAIITKEETVKLFLKLIDRNVNSSISLMMKNIDEFKINVTERSTN